LISVFDRLVNVSRKSGAGYFVLLDPEGRYSSGVEDAVSKATSGGADAILIGGSKVASGTFDAFAKKVKSRTELPVIVFPGNAEQLSGHADAVFFLSLVSGRNPRYLIDEHVRAAPIIRKMRLETIPVGYMVVGSGGPTSVVLESKTDPLDRDDLDSAVAHALAARYLGMRMLYLDAGSGARLPVPDEMIARVKTEAGLPLIVGGGIRKPEDASRKVEAGADFIVTGNVMEEKPDMAAQFSRAVHLTAGSSTSGGE
jgi:putative glycerol-1-phosphate prenyltransferase